MKLQNVLPADIEKRSMEIIGEELGELKIDPEKISIVKRVIHTSADFDYARNMRFSEGVVEKALEALKNGATIITDTNMACTGINKAGLAKLGAKAVLFYGRCRRCSKSQRSRLHTCGSLHGKSLQR